MCIEISGPKFFRCNKCGQFITKVENPCQKQGICTNDAPHRTSGICGGSFTIEMTEDEYNTQIKEWEDKRNNNV